VADARRVDSDRRLPRRVPPGPFHQWTTDNAYETTHYWSAYPEATTATSAAFGAQGVRRTALADRAITPDEFAREWACFLASVQGDL
jgi:hypothetical protein